MSNLTAFFEKTVRCTCGKRVRTRRRFKVDYNGDEVMSGSRFEAWKQMLAEVEAWKKEVELCTSCRLKK